MEEKSTKERILEEALRLFAKNGYLGRGKCESVYPCDDIPVMGEILGDMSGGIGKYGSEWKENFRI